MRLTFFASRRSTGSGNGTDAYLPGVLRGLRNLGHDIQLCAARTAPQPPGWNAEGPAEPWVVTYGAEQERDVLVRQALEDSEWVVKCGDGDIRDAEFEWSIPRLRGRARTAFWDVEVPGALARMAADPGDPLCDAMPRFHRVFTRSGGPEVMARYASLGARACAPIFDGFNPVAEYLAEPLPERRWDLLLMADRRPEWEERVTDFFFRAAVAAPDAHFALSGSGWEGCPSPPNVALLGHVPPADHDRMRRAARLVLNVHGQSRAEGGWCASTALFEAAGAACCQISDPWRGLGDFFARGREILVAESGAEVARLVREVSGERAAAVGRAARQRALAEHTFGQRALRMEALFRDEIGSERMVVVA